MSPFLPDAWLTPREAAEITALAEAVETTRRAKPEPVTRDTCERCGGLGCDTCRWADEYTPEYVRASIKRWKAAS